MIKSDVSDANGHRKRDFHEETIPIDTGEIYFRSTVTHFMIFCAILIIFCYKTVNTVMPKLSYDNVTMLDNMTRQCDTVMSTGGPAITTEKHLKYNTQKIQPNKQVQRKKAVQQKNSNYNSK